MDLASVGTEWAWLIKSRIDKDEIKHNLIPAKNPNGKHVVTGIEEWAHFGMRNLECPANYDVDEYDA